MFPRTSLAVSLLLTCTPGWAGVAFNSAHVMVVDDASGEVLIWKDVGSTAPIASLTKLLTAMVVLDARQDPNEYLRIDTEDTDNSLKHSRGGVHVGAVAARSALLELALLASDNRAASALARSYPGGLQALDAAMQRKIHVLGLSSTSVEDQTGLSPNNRSSAQDMIVVLRAAARYPDIAQITSRRSHAVLVDGRLRAVRNTNGLVGAPQWQVLLSKTGFTNEAGRCLAMRAQISGRTMIIVLMGAARPAGRLHDAMAIRHWLAAQTPTALGRTAAPSPAVAQYRRGTNDGDEGPRHATTDALGATATVVKEEINKAIQSGAAVGVAASNSE
jgi:D-alanyl-D-alanine endopeptidase (penicillin-binding protein 7)